MKTADRPGRRGRRRLGIKWKLLVYLLCFVAVMLGCLWLFQVVFLESFYKSIKEQNLKDCRAQVVRQLARQESPEDFLATLALKEGVAAAIYTTQGQLRYSVVTSPGETITRLGSNTIDQLAAQIEASGEILFVSAPRLQYKSWMAADDGGGYLFGKSKFPTQLSPPELNIQPRDSTIDNIQTLILGTAVSLPGGEEGYLFLSTALTPVSTTTQTLQVQLIYISLLLVALSAVLALSSPGGSPPPSSVSTRRPGSWPRAITASPSTRAVTGRRANWPRPSTTPPGSSPRWSTCGGSWWPTSPTTCAPP